MTDPVDSQSATATPATATSVSAVAPGTLAALPPPPREARALCSWAREALRLERVDEALDLWRKAGEPDRSHPAVAVAIALLEAEAGQWASVRDRVRPVLDAAHENPLAGGLAALAAYHTGDLKSAVSLFDTHGLFAAFPLVRLFIHSFALEVLHHRERFPWPGRDFPTHPSTSQKDPAVSRAGGVPSESESELNTARRSGNPGGFEIRDLRFERKCEEKTGHKNAQKAQESGGKSSQEMKTSDEIGADPAQPAALRPPFWKRFAHGGGLGPDSDARALVIEGDDLLQQGDLAGALRRFESALHHDPKNWMAAMAAGLCRIELGDFETAANDLVELLGRNPDVPNLGSAAAWGLLHLGEYNQALEILSTLAPAGPDDWGQHYIAALAFLGLDRRAESDRLLRQALGPFFLDTWEQFILPLFHRVAVGLSARTAGGDSIQERRA